MRGVVSLAGEEERLDRISSAVFTQWLDFSKKTEFD
jgi:hypothetical protein